MGWELDVKELANSYGTVRVEKRNAGESEPYEIVEAHNLWTTAGWNELLSIITGKSSSAFNSTMSVIGVGTSSTAAAITDTALLGTATYLTLLSGYPTVPASGQVIFKAEAGLSIANHSWQEWGIKNTRSGILWNRGVSDLGTKTSSEIWTITLTLGKN